jgi:hypothetical protein
MTDPNETKCVNPCSLKGFHAYIDLRIYKLNTNPSKFILLCVGCDDHIKFNMNFYDAKMTFNEKLFDHLLVLYQTGRECVRCKMHWDTNEEYFDF